ncbi:RagB/SusD family nutrient uptake outer membrane protein [Bacteroides xylanisolvens]|jgi:hypothetical protein|uniref:RagB/SusD family nutrient uptake outer membrane protein n=1 Tax=Bacteroides xylanisolvens TaxID=371601 RepID=A0A7J5Q0B5_9BACE|nr:RagB/SusD family nutrient uptake outer membrane protein [Bacteroides xylanisolvens]
MKIKKILSIFFLGSICIFTFPSCEDFLTETNPNVLTTDIYYTKFSDCKSGLTAVYNAFKQPNIYMPVEENLRSDVGVQGNKFRSAFDNTAYLQNFNDAAPAPNNKWAALYKAVFRANQLIEGLDKVEPTLTESQRTEFQQIKAQAFFFRGLFYFYLNTSFNHGRVPIIDYVPKSEAEFYRPVSESDQVIEFYRSDLKKALELGLNDSWDADNAGRATSYAAKAILGKSFLYAGDYATAKGYFKDIIDNGGYQLADVSDNMTTKGEFNSESILEVSYTTAYNTEFAGDSQLYNQWGMGFSKKGWNTVIVPFWLVEEYEEEYVDPKNDNNWEIVNYDSYRYQSDDNAENEEYDYKPDIIYNQAGKEYGYETMSANGDTILVSSYVFHQFPQKYDYEPRVYRRVVKKNLNGEDYIPDAKHVNPQYFKLAGVFNYKNFKFKQVGEKMYRLREYSRRASYSIAINGDETVNFYQQIPQLTAIFHNQESGYFRKLCNWDIRTKENEGTPVNSSDINLRLIRLADIYLMYAECLIKGGTDETGFDEALMYVNKVRQRAGTMLMGSEDNAKAEFKGNATYQNTVINEETGEPADPNGTMSTASELMEHLMYVERPLELCVEGHALRVNDLRRWEDNGVEVSTGVAGTSGNKFSVKGRFTYLSQQKFILETTYYWKPKTVGSLELVLGQNWGKQYRASYNPTKTPWVDYAHAAANYDDNVAYWPIPNTEIMSNPYID